MELSAQFCMAALKVGGFRKERFTRYGSRLGDFVKDAFTKWIQQNNIMTHTHTHPDYSPRQYAGVFPVAEMFFHPRVRIITKKLFVSFRLAFLFSTSSSSLNLNFFVSSGEISVAVKHKKTINKNKRYYEKDKNKCLPNKTAQCNTCCTSCHH